VAGLRQERGQDVQMGVFTSEGDGTPGGSCITSSANAAFFGTSSPGGGRSSWTLARKSVVAANGLCSWRLPRR